MAEDQTAADATEADEIEVGATGGSLRICLAREAMRNAEARLTAQAASLTATETRATSILGWVVAGVFLLGAGAVSDPHTLAGHFRAAAASAAIMLLASGLLCVTGLWPRDWTVVGYQPGEITDTGLTTELELLEHLYEGYSEGIIQNDARLISFGNTLATAWVFFLAAPVVALGVAYLLL